MFGTRSISPRGPVNWDTFVMIGQSNATGYGGTTVAPTAQQDNVWMLGKDDVMKRAYEPVNDILNEANVIQELTDAGIETNILYPFGGVFGAVNFLLKTIDDDHSFGHLGQQLIQALPPLASRVGHPHRGLPGLRQHRQHPLEITTDRRLTDPKKVP